MSCYPNFIVILFLGGWTALALGVENYYEVNVILDEPYTPYREVHPFNVRIISEKPPSGTREKGAVLLLHDYADNSETWEESGTLKALASEGYAAYALDIPGIPNSKSKGVEARKANHLTHTYEFIPLLRDIYRTLGVAKTVLIVPEYAVKYGISLVTEHDGPDLVSGLVLVSAGSIPVSAEKLADIKTPVLSMNTDLSSSKRAAEQLGKIPSAKLIKYDTTSKRFYKDSKNPELLQLFQDDLVDFLDSLSIPVGGEVQLSPSEMKNGKIDKGDPLESPSSGGSHSGNPAPATTRATTQRPINPRPTTRVPTTRRPTTRTQARSIFGDRTTKEPESERDEKKTGETCLAQCMSQCATRPRLG